MSEPIGEIFKLIPQVMRSVGVIGKGRKNQQQGYQFRGIDDVYNALQPVLCDLGVFIVPTVISETREDRQTKSGGTLIYTTLRMSFKFFAPDGSYVEAVTVGEAMDSGDKSSNKAQSAAMKYACLQVFCIPTEGDNDTENASPEPAPRAKPAPISKPPAIEIDPNDAMTDPNKFAALIEEAFEGRDFHPDDRARILANVCKSKRVNSILHLDLDQRRKMLAAIVDGKFDASKKHEVAPA